MAQVSGAIAFYLEMLRLSAFWFREWYWVLTGRGFEAWSRADQERHERRDKRCSTNLANAFYRERRPSL